MPRTRFIFGISVLFLAAGIVVTAQQGATDPKSTHTTTPVKAGAAKPVTKPATPNAAANVKSQAAPSSKAAASSKPVPGSPPAAALKPTAQAKPATMPGNKLQSKPGQSAVAAPKAAATSPTATASKTPAAKPDARTAKSTAVADAKTARTEMKSDKPSKAATAPAPKSKTAAPTPAAAQLTPVQESLKQNTALAAKLESRLPKGTNVVTAAGGFRDLGQFVAAVNVSNNLNVSFDELKSKIVGNKMSLGQAIQAVRPLTASPTIEAQRAEYDARGMIAESRHAEAPLAPRTHGPVTPSASTPATTPTATSTPVKAKVKTTKASAQ